MSHPPSHRRHDDGGPVANLDDFFTTTTEDTSRSRRRAVGRRPWFFRAALQTFITSAVLYTALHIVNLGPPYGLILAVCAGAVLVRLAVRESGEPDWLRARDVIRPVRVRRRHQAGGWYEGGDGMLDAVHRWDRRLDWGVSAPERFGATVGGRLGELADERLRQHHGLTRASDPVRARQLLGDDLWAFIHDRDRLPTPRQVGAALTRLEQMHQAQVVQADVDSGGRQR
jgi:hypothetical protein